MKNHIHIIKTGGTIEFHDPAYDEMNSKLMKFDSTIDSYLKNLVNPLFNFSISNLFQKDSRDITDEDREKLVREIQGTTHNNILITHGTYTMTTTGVFLKDKFPDKKIVLVGSMVPLSGFAISDAGFNLGFAIGVISSLEPGKVYIATQGAALDPESAAKNVEDMKFEEV